MVGELVTQHHAIIQMEHQQMAIQLSSNALEARFLLDLQIQHVKMVHGIIDLDPAKVRKVAYYWNVYTMDKFD